MTLNKVHTTRSLSKLLTTVIFATLTALTPLIASADGLVITLGQFNTFAAGIERGFDISGRVIMIRTPSGKTIVDSRARGAGLVPGTTYPSHVHNKACDDEDAGGHYQNVVGGPVDAINEIWPLLEVNRRGRGKGFAINDFRARPEAQSVVIHDTDGARIACADLE